jgi:hypothetical protein
VRVALKAAKHFGVDSHVVHLDSSSFHTRYRRALRSRAI